MSKFALLFVAVFFGGIIVALTYSGTGAFVLYQLVYFLNPDNRWWSASVPGLRYSMITVLLMMFVLVTRHRALAAKSPWSAQPASKWIVLILGMYYFMYLHAINPVAHDKFTMDFTKTVIIVAVAYKLIHSERALHAVMWGYIAGATYLGYLATVTGRNSGDRVEGIGLADGTDANDTAITLVPAAVILMYLAWMGNLKTRILCVVCGGLIANGLVLINSRGAFLGAAVGVTVYLLYMLFSRFQKKGQRAMAIVIIVGGLAGALYVTDDQFWERMTTMQDLEDESSGAGRMEFWWATFDMMKDHPAGLGIMGYQEISAVYMPADVRGNVEKRAVHSSWFQLLSEIGWPGPILFFFLLVSLWKVNRKVKKQLISEGRTDEYFRVVALEVALLSYMVSASFIDRFRSEILWWMILFVAAAGNVYYLQYQEHRANH
ncbi:MAG TPA: O-antigen ligase family protein, partial [Marinobacter sp.]|nr:O-antigen ligase family protein [Marinobacter sp.]